MDTKRLYNFIRVVELGSVTKAAQTLYVAQPALSQQLIALEAHFKTELLIRSATGVVPTAAGWELYRFAQRMLQLEASAMARVSGASAMLTGEVKVGLSPGTASMLFAPKLLTIAKQKFPAVSVVVDDSLSATLSPRVARGTLDFAILNPAGGAAGAELLPLFHEDLMLVVSQEHYPQFRLHEAVRFDDIKTLDWIIPKAPHAMRQAVERYFGTFGMEPVVRLELQSLLTIIGAVQAGLGATLLPTSMVGLCIDRQRFFTCRVESPNIERTIALCFAPDLPLVEAAAALREALLWAVRDHVAAADQRLMRPAATLLGLAEPAVQA